MPHNRSRVVFESRSRLAKWSALRCMLAVLLLGTPCLGKTGVTAEAVDNFCNINGENCSKIKCIGEADNYRNGLLNAPNTIFKPGERWIDDDVWDTDFLDPERTGDSVDADDLNFDESGNGTAYVCLHGEGFDTTDQPCTSSAQCTTPDHFPQRNPGMCYGNGPPNNHSGWCGYTRDRLLINSDSANNKHSNRVDYTNGDVAWGESASAGSWGGAGKNGGINFGLLSNSMGVRVGLWNEELLPMLAGMNVLGIIMPITPQDADTVDAIERGSALAHAYKTNPNGSIGEAWYESILAVPQSRGSDCPKFKTSYTYGGGHGIRGCGAHLTYTVDSSEDRALWNLWTERWNSLTTENADDSTGNAYWAGWYLCNYDCNKYPATL